MKAGKFITLEGIEGAGKGVQTRLLEAEFQRRGIDVVLSREPGGTAFGLEVRQVVLRRDGAPREPISELLLYLADRCQDLREKIEPALNRGLHVLCDRYHDATLAYQGYARGIGIERIDRLAELLEIRSPDLTIVLDLEVEVGIRRARSRVQQEDEQEWSRFEHEELAFHRKVREGYLLLCRREPERIRMLDASGSPEEVLKRIVALLEQTGVLA